jgi:hypothetical protein
VIPLSLVESHESWTAIRVTSVGSSVVDMNKKLVRDKAVTEANKLWLNAK